MSAFWTLAAALILSAAITAFQLAHTRNAKKALLPGVKKDMPEGGGEYGKRRREMLFFCKGRYTELFNNISVPPGSKIILKCSNIFGLGYVPLEHYIWRKGNSLHSFPTWESIALRITDPEYIPDSSWHARCTGADDSALKGQGEQLEYYAIDEYGGFTAVYSRDNKGVGKRIVFIGEADKIISPLFPGRLYTTIRRRAYLRSTQNITEINERVLQLKLKKDQGLISSGEYETQRDYLMRSM